jgi:inosine/xanthosine triphosphatase
LPDFRLVAIGSKNPAKTTGVRRVFSASFPRARFVEVETGSVVRAQPMTFRQILEGAKKRAEHAVEVAGADVGVGVEAGILSRSEKRLNLQLAVIDDAHGRSSVGSSAGFMLPEHLIKRIQSEGKELDRYAREITGAEKVEEMGGIIRHLSKGSVSRVEMTEQCVKMALVPWLNGELYGF